MAKNPYSGLFQGPSFGSVSSTMNQEREARIRQAMADNIGAGGNYYSGLIAKAHQQQAEAFKGLAGGLARGSGPVGDFLGQAMPEDPRLSAARKREVDKREIIDLLGTFTEVGSDSGSIISEKEMRIGYSELMKRGYPEEARKFLKDAQSEGLLEAKRNTALAKLQKSKGGGTELKFEGPVMKTTKGEYWQAASTKGAEAVFMQLTGPKSSTYDPVGAVIVDTKGADFAERIRFITKTTDIETGAVKVQSKYKEALKRGTNEALAVLNRRTDVLQQELNISEDMAKKRAGAELITEREYITGGTHASTALPKAQELLDIVDSGDYIGGKATAAFKSFKRLFNIEGNDDASFRTGTQMTLLKLLKPLMGAKATDQDLIELKDALANPMQTTEANKVILERFIRQLKRDIKDAKYFSSDSKASLAGLFRRRDAFSQLGTVPTPIAQRRVGEMIRKDGEAYKWNGSTWDKQ